MTKPVFWIYVEARSTPLAAPDAARLTYYLNELYRYTGAIQIVEGRATYRISNKVASFIAGNIIRGVVTQVQVLGEIWDIAQPSELLQLLRTVKTEMLYLDGVVVKSTGTAPLTAMRREYA